MAQLIQNEEIVISSKDKTITLTNFRVLYQSKEVNKEIYLKDIVGIDIVNKEEKYYAVGGIVCVLVAIYFWFNFYKHNMDREYTYVLVALAVSAFIRYYSSLKKILRLSSMSYNLEIPADNITDKGLKYLMDSICEEWNKQKP